MVVASPGNLCKINLNKRQRLRHFLNHKGIRSRFKCTSQSCAYPLFVAQIFKAKKNLPRKVCDTGDRGRTDTPSLERDFESRASANSATPA